MNAVSSPVVVGTSENARGRLGLGIHRFVFRRVVYRVAVEEVRKWFVRSRFDFNVHLSGEGNLDFDGDQSNAMKNLAFSTVFR